MSNVAERNTIEAVIGRSETNGAAARAAIPIINAQGQTAAPGRLRNKSAPNATTHPRALRTTSVAPEWSAEYAA